MTDLLVTFTASILIWVMYLGILVLWMIDGRIKREQALHALLASVIAWAASQMIKDLFPTLRPFAINNNPSLVIVPPLNGAFPSAHTAASFSLAVTVWLHDKKMGIIYLLMALAIGIARIIANVHYPLDIAGGALLGAATAFLVEKVHVFEFLSRKTVK